MGSVAQTLSRVYFYPLCTILHFVFGVFKTGTSSASLALHSGWGELRFSGALGWL